MVPLLHVLFLVQQPIANGVESWGFLEYVQFVEAEYFYYRNLYQHKKEVPGVQLVGDRLTVTSDQTNLPLQSGLDHFLFHMEKPELRQLVLSTLEARGMSTEDILYLRETAPVGVNYLDALNECYQQGYDSSPTLQLFKQPPAEVPAFESLVDAVREMREVQSGCKRGRHWEILEGLSGHGRRLVVDFAVNIQGVGASMSYQTIEAEANEWLSAFEVKK